MCAFAPPATPPRPPVGPTDDCGGAAGAAATADAAPVATADSAPEDVVEPAPVEPLPPPTDVPSAPPPLVVLVGAGSGGGDAALSSARSSNSSRASSRCDSRASSRSQHSTQDAAAAPTEGDGDAATASDVMVRRLLGWTGSTMGRGTVVRLDAVAMLASNVSVGDVAAAVRRALVRDGRPASDCAVLACGQRIVLWDDAPWPKTERVAGCHVLPSTIECAAQAQRAMSTRHVTSCCAATMAVLGVEAARAHFVQLTKHHLGLADADVAVQLAADTLFWPGYQLPLTRVGLAQQLPGHPLCRAAYETTMAVFAEAATENCVDPGTTISARVCRRSVPRLGSCGPSSVFSTAHGVVERRPPTVPRGNRATYAVFDFLSGQNNEAQAAPPKKQRLSRWSDAPWTKPFSTGCFVKPIL